VRVMASKKVRLLSVILKRLQFGVLYFKVCPVLMLKNDEYLESESVIFYLNYLQLCCLVLDILCVL
jgi:hypothetical protein